MKRALGDTSARILAFVILLAIAVFAILTLKILLVPLVVASFVAYLFDPAIVALQRRGMQRGPAFVLLLAATAIIGVILLALAPSQLRLESLNANVSAGSSERLEAQLVNIEQLISKRLPMFETIHFASMVNNAAGNIAGRVFEALPGVISSFVLNLLLVPFIAYFMVRDGGNLRRRIIAMAPNRYFEMTLIMLHRIDKQIGGYLRGRLIECSLVALTQMMVMAIAAMFVKQPQIFLISVVCGATNLIPYVGPLMGAGFGVLLYVAAYSLPLTSVYGLLIATLVAHLIDNIAIAPLVLSHNVDLHPLTVALVLVIGGELLGILGLLIAIPVAASLKVIGQEVYANYRLQRWTGETASDA